MGYQTSCGNYVVEGVMNVVVVGSDDYMCEPVFNFAYLYISNKQKL